jgi:predicted GIY-YIG superfamily endonuclease
VSSHSSARYSRIIHEYGVISCHTKVHCLNQHKNMMLHCHNLLLNWITINMPHCSYLIQSLSDCNHFYIGYTTCVQRRLQQHNGELSGGAHETKKHRPWALICYVSGFTSEIIGLQFEWAFQHPKRSKAFRDALPGRMAITRELTAATFERDKTVVGYLRRIVILLCETKFGNNSSLAESNSLDLHFSNHEIHGVFIQILEKFKREHERHANDSDDSDADRKAFCTELPSHINVIID